MKRELALQFRLSASSPLMKYTVWNNRGQPETPARRKRRVISMRRFEFFRPGPNLPW